MNFTSEQLACINSDHPRILATAVAGAGKSSTLVARIVRLVSNGYDPKDICVIVYTNSAARVVVEKLKEQDIEIAFCGTLHSFCLHHIRDFGDCTGPIRILDEEEANDMLIRCARNAGVAKSTLPLMKADMFCMKAYRRELILTNTFDYEFLLEHCLELLADKYRARRKWKHVLIDEAQDAAAIDFAIYNAIPADNRYITADPRQSIFAFRGGDIKQIETLVADPEWLKLGLTHSFRCSKAVCEAANRLMKGSGSAPETPQMTLESSTGIEGSVTSLESETDVAEAVAIVEWIKPRTANSDIVSDFAILTRTNAIADFIAGQFKEMDIPVCVRTKPELPKDWKLARAALELIINADSQVANEKYFRQSAPAEAERQIRLADQKQRPFRLPLKPCSDADQLVQELYRLNVSWPSIDIMKSRFTELPETADLSDLALSLALEPKQEVFSGEGVVISTVHGFKGREAKHIIVAGFEDEIFNKGDDQSENRRVCYVAITRAKETLLLSWAKEREASWGHRMEEHSPSRFLADILNV